MRRHRSRRTGPALACLLAAALIAAPAAADLKKVPPLAFRPFSPVYDCVYTPFWVGADASAATSGALFAASLKLPRNSTIDAVSFYYTAAGGAAGSLVFGYYDTAAQDTEFHVVASGTNAADASEPTLVTLDFAPGTDLAVRDGYRYMFLAFTPRMVSLWEARVSFTRP